jgi:phenylpyruvate tautomerase PptA (4-oxalocrotonate tautomerase family)
MPYLKIQTNREIDDGAKKQTLIRASARISELLGKSTRYVMVAFAPRHAMVFAGSTDPCAYLELKSIGLARGETATLSEALCDLIHRELGIPTDRVYIEFADAERPMWGWNGKTF